jgi:hypothetical protein
LPIEEKESIKWLELIDVCESKIPLKDHEVWVIGDRESDIYEYMAKPRHANLHLIIRACQPRRVFKESGETPTTLFKHLATLPIAGSKQVELTRENRNETIELSVRYDNVNILSPMNGQSKTAPASIPMGVVYAREEPVVKSATGNTQEAIEWVLLVDKNIEDLSEAIKFLDYYSQRWKIERFHYTLKQGFKVEKLQFDDAHTLINVIAFYSILAWLIQWVTYLGRLQPNLPAREVLDDVSIEVLEAVTKKKITTAEQVMITIGILGGFIGGSKRYPYPGLKSMWQGIAKLEAMKQGWLLAKSKFAKKYAT